MPDRMCLWNCVACVSGRRGEAREGSENRHGGKGLSAARIGFRAVRCRRAVRRTQARFATAPCDASFKTCVVGGDGEDREAREGLFS
jgi:hypothetical protein